MTWDGILTMFEGKIQFKQSAWQLKAEPQVSRNV